MSKHTPNWDEVGPELLVALKGMLRLYDEDDEQVNDRRIALARITIAKAEGREQ